MPVTKVTRRKFCLSSILALFSIKAKAAPKDFVCLQCGACCWSLANHPTMYDCAEKNLIWKDGKYWCKLHDTDKYPDICRDYPADGVCLRMLAERKNKEICR